MMQFAKDLVCSIAMTGSKLNQVTATLSLLRSAERERERESEK